MIDEELEPMTPQKAKDLYLDDRQDDASFETLQTITPVVDLFVKWCEQAGVMNMNDVRGRELTEFKNWCKETSDNNIVSLNGILGNVRRFLVFCVKIEAVASDTPGKTPIPNVPDDEDVNEEKPSDEQVEGALEYLQTYEPASRAHIEFRLIKDVGCRVGAIRAIDIKDIVFEEEAIRLKHRPEKDRPDVKGTPLKNKSDGERHINIPTDLMDLIRDYIDSPNRHDVTDRFGRRPLLTTKNGRPSTDTIRRDLYKLTRPCVYGNHCPHDRDIDSCEFTHSDHASKCPSSHSPHPLRRWSIESQIDRGVAKELLTDRVDVSVPILNKHYDRRSKERKRKHRLKILSKLYDGYGDDEETLNIDEVGDELLNEDGMIDPQALLQLESNTDRLSDVDVSNQTSEREEDVEPKAGGQAEDQGEDEPEVEEDDDQMDLGKFGGGVTAVFGPGSAAVGSAVTLGAQTTDRLHREMESLSSGETGVQTPSPGRAANSVAGYVLFVGMLAVNFGLLGIVPA